jgi:FkbM family methyltransferase
MSLYTIEAHNKTYQLEADPESRVGRALASGLPYEHHLLEHIYSSGFRGWCADIGAHIGNHSLYFSIVCGLQVIAFEPLEQFALECNLRLNPHANVNTYPFALGAMRGTAKVVGKGRLEMDDNGPCLQGESCPDREGYGLIHVQVVNLDSMALPKFSFIKMDVEDMEPAVLLGARATIERDHPVIFAEARDADASRAISEVISPLGYKHTLTAKTSTPVERWDYCQ